VAAIWKTNQHGHGPELGAKRLTPLSIPAVQDPMLSKPTEVKFVRGPKIESYGTVAVVKDGICCKPIEKKAHPFIAFTAKATHFRSLEFSRSRAHRQMLP
jgi:hypothetical protein